MWNPILINICNIHIIVLLQVYEPSACCVNIRKHLAYLAVTVLQQICDDWANKPEDAQQFEPFYRAVSAVAHSSGIKLKTRAQLLTKVLNGWEETLFTAVGV